MIIWYSILFSEGLFHITCPAVTIGLECGEEVENAVSGFLENTDYDLAVCPKEVLEEIRPFQDIFKLAIIEEKMVENEIKRKK